MDFKDYETEARKTSAYPYLYMNGYTPGVDETIIKVGFVYPAMGLNGEAGEVNEKLKKILRDKQGMVSEADKVELKKELGDVLWYIANLCYELGLDMNEIAEANIAKLRSRKERGVIHGSGDNR